MARKLVVSKPGRPNYAAEQASSRRSAPTAATLYLMQLRAQSLKISAPSRGVRLDVSADPGTEAETPQSVKITQVDSED